MIEEKKFTQNFVNSIFSDVASKYDLMNDIMSFGLHRLWKQSFVNQLIKLVKVDNPYIIDAASGSGDIAINIYKEYKKLSLKAEVLGIDINETMLQEARSKAINQNCMIKFIEADCKNLQFDNNSFDGYTIAFGIRNVDHIQKALQEANRVLKNNGIFLCMEFGKIVSNISSEVYNYYLKNFIPNIGSFITNNKSAYQHLSDTILSFPSTMEFISMLKEAGFTKITHNTLCFNIVNIYVAHA